MSIGSSVARPFGMAAAALVAAAAAAAAPSPEQARTATTDGSTTITAGVLTYDYRRSMAVFEQNVVVVDPQVRIESDALTVFFEGTNDIRSVTATGNVRLYSEGRTAHCRRAVYQARLGEVLMTGGARLVRGRDTLEGDSITFWLNQERVECRPGRLTVYPERGAAGGGLPEGLGGRGRTGGESR